MKTYQTFAKQLLTLLDHDQAVRITVPGFMPLGIEELLPTAEGNRQISLAHYGDQNGDAMRDPELVFELIECGDDLLAEPVYFRNDYAAIEQWVYDRGEDGHTIGFRPRLKRDLRIFARTWLRNLRAQGFFDRDATREVLS